MRACQPKDAKRREWGSVWERERVRERERESTHMQEREIPGPLALLFMFFPPLGPALCILG